mgnify:CR=1 FL=1
MKQILKTIIKDFHLSRFPHFHPRDLVVPLDLKKIITIIGPRRAGKTWFLYQLMTQLEDQGVARERILYLNFEDERLEFEGEYDQILNAYLELYPERPLGDIYLFFDEIQELPNWQKYIRRLYDRVTPHIFLTGSNAKMLSSEIATSLRGRSLSFEILPLSFAEYLSFQGVNSTERDSTRNRATIQHYFDQYLLWGGFPELVTIEERFKPAVLQEYFSVMLYRDLVERYEIRNLSLVKFLLKRLISSFSKEFSTNKLYNDLKSRGFKVSKDHLYQLMEEIFSIYLLAPVSKYDPAVIRREMSNRKVYLYDNGLASITQYAFSEDRGKLLENTVYAHLRRHTESIFFLKNGFECDFVVFGRGSIPCLIQVVDRLHHDNLAREVGGLEKAQRRFEQADCLLLVNEIEVDVPAKWNVRLAVDWLLDKGDEFARNMVQ